MNFCIIFGRSEKNVAGILVVMALNPHCFGVVGHFILILLILEYGKFFHFLSSSVLQCLTTFTAEIFPILDGYVIFCSYYEWH